MDFANENFTKNDYFRFLVFSYLSGCDLFHKIALLNKSYREKLPSAGLLDQIISITIKKSYSDDGEVFFATNSFLYAI